MLAGARRGAETVFIKPAVSSIFHDQRLQGAHACARLGGAEFAGRPEHGAQKDCGRDAAGNLPEDVAGHAAPREIPSYAKAKVTAGLRCAPLTVISY